MYNQLRMPLTLAIAVLLISGTIDQAAEPDQLEQRVLTLLKSQEFKEDKTQILTLGKDAEPILLRILSSPDHYGEFIVQRALTIVAEMKDRGSAFRKEVTSLLASKDGGVRYRAVIALGTIGSAEDSEAVLGTLSDPREDVRVQSAIAVGKIGNGKTLPLLHEWKKQAADVDKLANPSEKRGTEPVLKALEEAMKAIEARGSQ